MKLKNQSDLNLYDIMQNNSIGALACHSFTVGYYQVARNKENIRNYPPLKYFFFILPIVYHSDTCTTFKSSNHLQNAITKNQKIILGLQERANKMSTQTFDSLNIAFSKQILTYNPSTKEIETMKGFKTNNFLKDKQVFSNISIKNIIDCARKLGNLFAKNDEKNIQLKLNIRF